MRTFVLHIEFEGLVDPEYRFFESKRDTRLHIATTTSPTALRLPAKKLSENMRSRENVEIVAKDFLRVDLPEFPYKVFSNIPFHLSSKIVRKLVMAKNPPGAIYLIVQKQFAQKMITGGNHFHGALGMAIAPWWVARIRRPLRKTDFTPPPNVDTVLLELKPRDTPLLSWEQMASYMQFVEQCYAEPKFYAKIGGPKDKKPSQLSLEEWVALAG
jgi:16S rRNA A1518/A1519 N6-dimethyltransferase RsmA/KsgA/DIM1 with predicted DNA glycosylase/AP lyase activity